MIIVKPKFYPRKSDKKPHRTNEMIKARKVRLIDENKKQIGIVPIEKALSVAQEKDLDLVEVAPNAKPPVCRVLEYGKYLYDLHKKEQEAKKHQKQVQTKEIKFRPKISIHDYSFKVRHIKRFLKEGNKVKVTVMLRGREKAKPELADDIIERVFEDVKNLGKQDGKVRRQPWAVSTLLSPIKSGERDAKTENT
ncbi:MAG: translation initiation factor IF-3 [Acidobacteriota bacterium]